MKTSFKKIYLFSVVIAALAISSCKKNENITPAEPTVSTNIKNNLAAPVKEDDYLVFTDQDNLLAYQKEYVNKKNEELDKWEQGLNFTSYRKLFNQATDEMENVNTDEQYNSFKSKYNTLVKFSEDGTIEYKYLSNFAPFINKDGIVKVGNIFYKLTEDRMIFIMDGDKSKINTAVNYHESRPDQNILVSHIEKTKIAANTRAREYHIIRDLIRYNQSISGSNRTEVWAYFTRYYNPITTGAGCGWSEEVYVSLEVKNSTPATFGGGWKEKKCSTSAQGGFGINVVVPPLSESCNGLSYYGGPMRKLNTPFDFGFEYFSFRVWQIYSGAEVWNFVNPSQNYVVNFWSNTYSACLGYNVPCNL